MLGQKDRRDLKPDAQPFDKIVIETVPRWKDSYMSGSEWRVSAKTSFYRKGALVHETYSGDVTYASYLLAGHHIEACDNAKGYFAGERDVCDQEGCENKATILAKKKFDWCKSGHKSEEPSVAYRLFCEKHSSRGDCGLDDADSNYDKLPFMPTAQETCSVKGNDET